MSAGERSTEILELARDEWAGFLAVSDNDHKYIHAGKGFSVKGNTGSLAAGTGVYYLTFRTAPASADAYVHLRPTSLFSSANILLMEIHEGSTVTSLGTASVPQNMNRNSLKRAKTLVYLGSSTVTDGVSIAQSLAGSGGSNQGQSGGGSGTVAERVLKPDTIYTVKMSAIGSSTATTGYFELFFYEEGRGA